MGHFTLLTMVRHFLTELGRQGLISKILLLIGFLQENMVRLMLLEYMTEILDQVVMKFYLEQQMKVGILIMRQEF
jgi:hypothetical protein